ncbi:MAG: hypothetical protein ACFFFB_08525 [Candidatus Heimdallarchaeota archaeon]
MPKKLRDYETVEEASETLDGSREYHALYLKAVNHPIRKEILNIVNKAKSISRNNLFDILSEKNLLTDYSILDYHIDFLLKALCIEKGLVDGEVKYIITQSGKVVEYLR